ncbi:3-hydroxyacyl-CoA dehydrogenase family protein [Candidatus Bathyarchaeota archaeon]|nr:3-hydroxyacyl-CoA dehydrogenase family protein [Candidatus Bathyarchaeota archaeon]
MKIKRIACVGAGTIGHSWATLFATKGYDVSVYDVRPDLLRSAMERIKASLDFLSEKGLITNKDAEAALDRIKITSEMPECVRGADYVQESAFESYEVKKKIFSEVDRVNDSAIIATSSSGLLMTEIQKATGKPERCIVAHPWNPPLLLRLVELVPGEKTSQETVQATYDLMERLDKTPVVVKKEVPGFIGNRIQAALWREALSLVYNGVASVEDVDRAVRAGPGARWAIMGPFLTLHLGGGPGGLKYHIDTIQHGFNEYWKTMEDWKLMPYHAAKKAIEGVEQLPMVKEKTLQELIRWRDNKLVEILKIQE